jgi:hypothetical protein
MVIRGRIKNGVVVLEMNAAVPEGAEVTIDFAPVRRVLPNDPALVPADPDRQRALAIMDQIAALPIEGKTDPFGGAAHDAHLYARRTSLPRS